MHGHMEVLKFLVPVLFDDNAWRMYLKQTSAIEAAHEAAIRGHRGQYLASRNWL